MNDLPIDLMGEIFLRCLPTEGNAKMRRGEAPVLLCQICRSWRQLCLEMPSMWSSLHIVTPSQSACKFSRGAIIEEWLRRSQALPLSISVAYNRVRPTELLGMPDGERVMNLIATPRVLADVDAIIPYLPRLRSLDLTLGYLMLTPFEKITRKDVSELNELSITLEYLTYDDGSWARYPIPILSFVSGLLAAPSLTSLSFAHFGDAISELPLQWKQLTRLRLLPYPHSAFFVNEAADILRLCPALEECDLIFEIKMHAHSLAMTDSRIISLPRLHALSIHTEWDISVFFSQLELPSLRRLYFCGPSLRTDGHYMSLIMPSEQAIIPLETLGLRVRNDNNQLSIEFILHQLRTIPQLKSFSYRELGPKPSDAALDRVQLFHALSAVDICPQLRDLDLSFIDATRFDEDSMDLMGEMFASRRLTLRTVRIHVQFPQDIDEKGAVSSEEEEFERRLQAFSESYQLLRWTFSFPWRRGGVKRSIPMWEI